MIGIRKLLISEGGVMEDISQTLMTYVVEFMDFLPKLIVSLVIFIIFIVIAGFASRGVRITLQRRGTDPELTILMRMLTRWAIIILGAVLALEQVDFDLTAFLAGIGIIGFTVGFAIQDVSKNFVAGLLLLLQQPFDIGDAIEVGGFSGKVMAVDLRATEILTFDGRHVLIPNADVYTQAIVNFSRADRRRININVGVAYDSDLQMVKQTALEAIQELDGLLHDPAPNVYYHSLSPSTIDFTIYYWVDMSKSDPFVGKDQGVAEIKDAFEKAGIEMPYPISTVINK
jgi:small conductance mechanosensitive channel